jgi:hypothetical protein
MFDLNPLTEKIQTAALPLLTRARNNKYASKDITQFLTNLIKQQAINCGVEVKTEHFSSVTSGFVDLALFKNKELCAVIELDRGNKQWSLEKLVAYADAGVPALWIRWGKNALIAELWEHAMHHGVKTLDLTWPKCAHSAA